MSAVSSAANQPPGCRSGGGGGGGVGRAWLCVEVRARTGSWEERQCCRSEKATRINHPHSSKTKKPLTAAAGWWVCELQQLVPSVCQLIKEAPPLSIGKPPPWSKVNLLTRNKLNWRFWSSNLNRKTKQAAVFKLCSLTAPPGKELLLNVHAPLCFCISCVVAVGGVSKATQVCVCVCVTV